MRFPRRIALGFYPTPLEELERLSSYLGGPRIYIKRDDQTGLASGGNKTRKLEFVLADAKARMCDHLVTLGGPQSNHCRQTAAAAARLGLGCSLVLRGYPPTPALGNLLLDELFGAEIHWSGDRTREIVAEEVVSALRMQGSHPYLIPLGASTGLGTLGYVAAMEEVLCQLKQKDVRIDAIVVASSSAGTQAGLVLGAAVYGYLGRILGISIDAPEADLVGRVAQLTQDGAEQLQVHAPLGRFAIDVDAGYLGGGYAVVGDLERDAIRTVAKTEGLLLDPVYTGRAMGALIDLVHTRTFGKKDRVLFWHTGGAAALSAFSRELRTVALEPS